MDYRTVSAKLSVPEYTEVTGYCKKRGVSSSKLIRSLLADELKPTPSDFVAGNNRIEYNSRNDRFAWIVDTDIGEERAVLENLSEEFLKDLAGSINRALEANREVTNKKRKGSVSVPRKMLKIVQNSKK
jgi:hypothetical protein